METVEQVNNDFNVKKPKKKGLIIGGIIVAVLIIAFVLIYFLVLAKPQFIFNGAIDKLFKFESYEYNSVKMDSKMKVSIETEDSSMKEQLAEVEKYSLKLGTQADLSTKEEIVNLGLEYDNNSVIDAQVYYNNGEMYTYFEGLYDKYIKMDINEEQKEQIEAIFDTASLEENKENTKKAMKIIRDELKTQIKEKGEFDKEKTTIDIGDKEKRVTKSTLTLSEKQLCSVISNMCSNLAENDEFLECFEESPKEILKELADEIKDQAIDSKNKIKISIYTKGLLNNCVGVDVQIYTEESNQTVTISVVKEDKDLYAYNVSVKTASAKVDAIQGKVEIEKDKDSKDEQTGKTIITVEVAETGKARLEVDYSIEYNKGVDKIDTSNSINMNEITEEDMQGIMENLMERPIIGDLVKSRINNTNGSGNGGTTTLNTAQNEVKEENYGYSVEYSIPSGFKYEEDYSYDYAKYYSLEDANSEIDAIVSLRWNSDDDYKDEIDWDYNYYKDSKSYKNASLGDLKTVKVGDKEFKYQVLTYESDSEYYDEKYYNAYVWYNLDEEHVFTVELESTNKEISEDIIKGFLNINIKEI